MKLGILNFTAATGMLPHEVLLPYLAAAANPFEAVASRGEELARKRWGSPPLRIASESYLLYILFAVYTAGYIAANHFPRTPPHPKCIKL